MRLVHRHIRAFVVSVVEVDGSNPVRNGQNFSFEINKNINTKACCQNTQSYMFTCPLLQHKHTTQSLVAKIHSLTCLHTLYNNINIPHKGSLPKFPVFHVYMPSTTTQTYNTKNCCQNSQS